MTTNTTEHNPLLSLIDLGHKARAAATAQELSFLLVNDSQALFPYRQAFLWRAGQGVVAVSGVLQADRHSPMLQWLERFLAQQAELAAGVAEPRLLTIESVGLEDGEAWQRWLATQAWWLPVPVMEGQNNAPAALLVTADELNEAFLPLWQEWLHSWAHADASVRQRQSARWWQRWLQGGAVAKPWYRRAWPWLLAASAALAIPVPLTVVAPAELVAKDPVVIRAPLDGVVNEFHVTPNQPVKAGQAIFSYDNEVIKSRLQVARQTLAAAQTEYRQAAQTAFSDPKAKFQLAALVARIQEKQTEAKFLAEQVGRTTVVAPQAGVVLFDEVAEWIGKPVQTGERVVRLADPKQVEMEAWLALGDAVPLGDESEVKLFFTANPLESVTGKVRWVGYEAQPRPDGTFAYRVRATLTESTPFAVGAKGTARIHAGQVTLGFWLFRKPLAVLRGYLML